VASPSGPDGNTRAWSGYGNDPSGPYRGLAAIGACPRQTFEQPEITLTQQVAGRVAAELAR
jgi:hypothetical protein